ncbi:hypothetical protein EKO04_008745 [Ascochyta lentis]|uniref:Uncharacterized protein n=1 Tax=Ascochyta lentis TaxID=205686 RepID=A0A8H7IWX3_9PLEO|nr:hypothetical protein EKO04_008745 [Ascochyta lentis]
MPCKVAQYFSEFFNPTQCECCDHHYIPEEEEPEVEPTKKSLRTWFESLRWNKNKTTLQAPHDTDTQVIKKRRSRTYFCLGKKKGRDVQRRIQTPGAARAVPAVNEGQYTKKCAVRQILDAIFADIVETDRALECNMDAATQCFLVHTLSDIDPEDSFFSQYQKLPSHADELDLDHGLSFASSWLQSSLGTIRDGYESGEAKLQMPFCVLEKNYQSACARAFALQKQYPDERAAIVTLDFIALKNAKLIASAKHTFDFLRVSRESLDTENRLLLCVESGNDGRPAEALLEAVLTIVKWEEGDNGVELEDVEESVSDAFEVEVAPEDGICKTVPNDLAGPPKKKDSVVTERTLFEEDAKSVELYPGIHSVPN